LENRLRIKMNEKQQIRVDTDVVVPVKGLKHQTWVTTGTAFWKGHNGEHLVELTNRAWSGAVMDATVSGARLKKLNARPWGSD